MSHENTDLTRNEPLTGGGAPFLYMQGDQPPGGSGGRVGEPSPDDEEIPTSPPEGDTPLGDQPPGGSGGDTTLGDQPPGGSGGDLPPA